MQEGMASLEQLALDPATDVDQQDWADLGDPAVTIARGGNRPSAHDALEWPHFSKPSAPAVRRGLFVGLPTQAELRLDAADEGCVILLGPRGHVGGGICPGGVAQAGCGIRGGGPDCFADN